MKEGICGADCESYLMLNPPTIEKRRKEGIIRMDDHWFLNHYNGYEGFLGWLILSPIKHREKLSELTPEETKGLGGHIRNVEIVLKKYWDEQFRNDEFWKIYVVSFSESKGYHLHFHLIPRTKKFSGSFSSCKPAWETPKMTICWDDFPEEYRIRCREKAIMGNAEIEKMGKIKDLIAFIKDFMKADWLIEPK